MSSIPPTIPHADWCHEADRTDDSYPCACDDLRTEMARTIFTDLVGSAELAAELGVSKQSISNYTAGRAHAGTGFPPPVTRLRATPVWSRAAVKRWWAGLHPA